MPASQSDALLGRIPTAVRSTPICAASRLSSTARGRRIKSYWTPSRASGASPRWAKDADADILARTKGNFAKGRKADHAVNQWIELLGNVWRDVLEREPGTSVVVTGADETRADGPTGHSSAFS